MTSTTAENARVGWVLLTMGDRPSELAAAVDSIHDVAGGRDVTVVVNGGPGDLAVPHARTVRLDTNLGVPGGRNVGMARGDAPVVAFLDDDAVVATEGANALIERAFAQDEDLAVIAMRIEDAGGHTSRRHVPRTGRRGERRGGDVATFLGGACVIRRSAFDEVGGYWDELFYGHEELELAWRLLDAGHRIRYAPDLVVVHPRTDVGRHARGWYMTGRNRVRVARRTLPRPISWIHVAVWSAIGVLRAPGRSLKKSYVSGLVRGMRDPVDRSPIRFATCARLTRLGRPPIL